MVDFLTKNVCSRSLRQTALILLVIVQYLSILGVSSFVLTTTTTINNRKKFYAVGKISSDTEEPVDPFQNDESTIKKILTESRTIALVGISNKRPQRPSERVMEHLQQNGYRVIPVSPILAAKGVNVLGEKVFSTLRDIPYDIDMVDIFM